MTNAEKQAAFKARKRKAGLALVHNIWAKPENHEAIKRFAASLTCDKTPHPNTLTVSGGRGIVGDDLKQAQPDSRIVPAGAVGNETPALHFCGPLFP